MLKRALKSLLERFGVRVTRSRMKASASRANPYHAALSALLTNSKTLTIIQVGANDGRLNDPLYPFAMEFRDRTHLLLLEPQAQLLPYLRENYKDHPSANIVCAAIGPESNLRLYSIRSAAWPYAQPPYARNWPEYRAPTGVASNHYQHVFDWLKSQSRADDHWVREMIEETYVESLTPKAATAKMGCNSHLDVLQVDCEGMDEVIVSMFLEDGVYPRLINLEKSRNFTHKTQELGNRLSASGYKCFENGRDQMWIRSSRAFHENK